MQEHTVTLQDDEFRLFQTEEMNKWLQVGDKTCFRPIEPVKPKKGSPLASQIIIEQRNRLIGNTK